MKTILILLLSAFPLLGGPLGDFINPSASFTRPGDTTAYASGDLVANSTTAGSVVAPVFTIGRSASGFGQQFRIDRIKISKSTVTTTNASFRVHLYRIAPTVANGDNSAFSTSGAANDLGFYDVIVDQAFTDGATGFVIGGPESGGHRYRGHHRLPVGSPRSIRPRHRRSLHRVPGTRPE